MTFAPGQLHTVLWHGDGTFNVAKILVVDEVGVHVRVYAEPFLERPESVPDVLEVGSPYDGAAFGVGHIPVTTQEFERWEPRLIGEQPVSPDELDGYLHWQREAADTGYFGEEKPGLIGRLLGRGKKS